MAWNGLGTYILSPLFSPEVNGTIIDAARYNGLTNDIAAGISFCLAKDGENSPIANLPMAGYKHTGAGNASAAGEYLVYDQAPLYTDLISTLPTKGANFVGYDYNLGYDVDTAGQAITGLLDSVQEVFGTTDQIVITANEALQQLTWSLDDDLVVVSSVTAPSFVGTLTGSATSVVGQTPSLVNDTVVVRGPTGNFAGNIIAAVRFVGPLNGGLDLPRVSNVRAQRITTDQACAASTLHTIVFNVEVDDVLAEYSPGTGIFTGSLASGWHLVTVSLFLQNSSGSAVTFNGAYLSVDDVNTIGDSFLRRNDLGGPWLQGESIASGGGTAVFSGTAMLLTGIGTTIRVKVDVGAGAGSLVAKIGSTLNILRVGTVA